MNGEKNGSTEELILPMSSEVHKPEIGTESKEEILTIETSHDKNHDEEKTMDIMSNGESVIANHSIETSDQNKECDAPSSPVTLQNLINEKVEDNLKLSDNVEIKETQGIGSNNNKEHVATQGNRICETKAEDVECLDKENLSLQSKTYINGIETSHISDNESCHYVDDPIDDPISTIDTNEQKENESNLENKKPEEGIKPGTFEIVAIRRHNSSEDNSSDCGSEDELEDTVSLTSRTEDDSSDNDTSKSNDVIVIDNDYTDNQNGQNSKSPEIHEIGSDLSDNDDCVVTAVEKLPKTSKKRKNPFAICSELRRSSRAVKQKRYSEVTNIESDDEVLFSAEEPFNPADLYDGEEEPGETRSWMMVAKSPQKNSTNASKSAQKSKFTKPNILKNSSAAAKSATTRNICESIKARGISVVPFKIKSIEAKSPTIQTSQVTPTEPLLPTLTDDMFVVEAPSFIVPYVYEKPAVIPLKEYVSKWGKELEEERAKEAKEALEKKIAEKAKRQQEKQEKRDRGEKVEDSEEELSPEAIEKKKAEKAERKERRRRKKEDDEDDVSWDGESSEESDETISDDDSQSQFQDKFVDHAVNSAPPPKTDSFFEQSLGKFFINIGANLIQEYVQNELINQEKRKLRRENRAGHDNRKRKVSIAQLTSNLEMSKKANEPYQFELKKCKFCSFKTESDLIMAHHMETPHMKNNMYICNFCSVEIQSAHNILLHMEQAHKVKGRLERALPTHQCTNCLYEDQGKGKLGRHLIGCAKRFKPETNLAPPIDWEHPAKIPKMPKPRAPTLLNQVGTGRPGPRMHPIGAVVRMMPRPSLTSAPLQVRPSGLIIRPPVPQNNSNLAAAKKQSNHSYVISTAPRQATPIQPINAANAKGVVMCEICDGYIKDLEQLRNHMQWIHRIKIHPKMIYNRPPLNCQKCQFRFFTDQGLERHLLGSHGLVTSAIQEAANKGKDAGRCPVCGRAYQRKLLAHVSSEHKLVLKPAHLSYKCTVCAATFGMYRQFENHVYSTHSVVAKKAIDKKTAAAAAAKSGGDAPKTVKKDKSGE